MCRMAVSTVVDTSASLGAHSGMELGRASKANPWIPHRIRLLRSNIFDNDYNTPNRVCDNVYAYESSRLLVSNPFKFGLVHIL